MHPRLISLYVIEHHWISLSLLVCHSHMTKSHNQSHDSVTWYSHMTNPVIWPSHMTNPVIWPSHMTLSHDPVTDTITCLWSHDRSRTILFENISANAQAKLALTDDFEDLFGIRLDEDHFMSVPLVACILSYSFFIIPVQTLHVLGLSRTISLCLPYVRLSVFNTYLVPSGYLSHTSDYQCPIG